MARKFNELIEKMPSDARARAEEKAAKLIAEYALNELRAARSMTQARLADILGKDQSVISRIKSAPICMSVRSRNLSGRWVGNWRFGRYFPKAQSESANLETSRLEQHW